MSTWEEMIECHGDIGDRNDFEQHPDGGWIKKGARVTGGTISEMALVLGGTVLDSALRGKVRVEGGFVILSDIDDESIIRGNAESILSEIRGRSILQDNVYISKSRIEDSILKDKSNLSYSICVKAIVEGKTSLCQCVVHNCTVKLEDEIFHNRIFKREEPMNRDTIEDILNSLTWAVREMERSGYDSKVIEELHWLISRIETEENIK